MGTRIAALAAALVVTVLATGAGCLPPDPCTQIPPPNPELMGIADRFPNVELDYVIDETTECDLVGNRWERERD